ncbi:hypothetical protein DFH29DRAFT_893498 [Suillus ampliporus]|nr:hypothetical protein DFH29DRAFT_893498 [Suillus ampliporus]
MECVVDCTACLQDNSEMWGAVQWLLTLTPSSSSSSYIFFVFPLTCLNHHIINFVFSPSVAYVCLGCRVCYCCTQGRREWRRQVRRCKLHLFGPTRK